MTDPIGNPLAGLIIRIPSCIAVQLSVDPKSARAIQPYSWVPNEWRSDDGKLKRDQVLEPNAALHCVAGLADICANAVLGNRCLMCGYPFAARKT